MKAELVNAIKVTYDDETVVYMTPEGKRIGSVIPLVETGKDAAKTPLEDDVFTGIVPRMPPEEFAAMKEKEALQIVEKARHDMPTVSETASDIK